MSPSDYQSFIYFRAVSHKKRVYKSVTCHRFLSSPLLEPVCWVTPVTRVFIIFVEVPVTPVTQRYAENSGQNHIVFLFVCLFVSSKLGKSRGYFPMQKCLKILFSVSWLLICPPVISPSSSKTILRSSAMMSPLMPMSMDSKTRAREALARERAS